MGAREEKVNQKGADPRKETRITKPMSPMKNFVERCLQPVMEYLFMRDHSYSIVTPKAIGERVHFLTVKSRSSWMSRDKTVQSVKCRV
jgi:hypothetical protein